MQALETFEPEDDRGGGGFAGFAQQLEAQLPALRGKAIRLERTASDAEDLVQDTLERALRCQHRFIPGTNLRSWLATIMHNLFLDHCRARNRRELAAEDDTPSLATAEDDPSPDWQQVSLGEVEALSRALRPRLRATVELVFFSGLNYEEAALRLHIPKATVGTRLMRARRQLRRMIEEGRHEAAAS